MEKNTKQEIVVEEQEPTPVYAAVGEMSECHDCKRIGKIIKLKNLEQEDKTINLLVKTEACSDAVMTGKMCCYKYVCYGGCVYKCPNEHECKVENDSGWIKRQTCTICNTKFTPKFLWWGLSIKDAYLRAGWRVYSDSESEEEE
jgi:hypothetical protein